MAVKRTVQKNKSYTRRDYAPKLAKNCQFGAPITADDYALVELIDLGESRLGFKVTLKDGRIGRCTLLAEEINALQFPEAMPPPESLQIFDPEDYPG